MNVSKILTEETIERIVAARAAGEKLASIARRLRCSVTTVERAVNQTEACLAAARQAEARRRERKSERQRAARHAVRRERQASPFAPKPIRGGALCPGCGGVITLAPCILCRTRGETPVGFPRPLPALWQPRLPDIGPIREIAVPASLAE